MFKPDVVSLLLKQMCEAGYRGRNSGKGFFDYST
jgi:3-hydroxyacyl-CoA dehydrogenase